MPDLFRAVFSFVGVCIFCVGTQWNILGTATPRARERGVSMSQLCVEMPAFEAKNPAALPHPAQPPTYNLTKSDLIYCWLFLALLFSVSRGISVPHTASFGDRVVSSERAAAG